MVRAGFGDFSAHRRVLAAEVHSGVSEAALYDLFLITLSG
jgi:hypothetical protein